MSDYPVPPKPDGRPNASFDGYTEAPLTDAEIEELKNRDTRDPEEIATDEERNRCLELVKQFRDNLRKYAIVLPYGIEISMLNQLIKEIEDGAKTPAPSSD